MNRNIKILAMCSLLAIVAVSYRKEKFTEFVIDTDGPVNAIAAASKHLEKLRPAETRTGNLVLSGVLYSQTARWFQDNIAPFYTYTGEYSGEYYWIVRFYTDAKDIVDGSYYSRVFGSPPRNYRQVWATAEMLRHIRYLEWLGEKYSQNKCCSCE